MMGSGEFALCEYPYDHDCESDASYWTGVDGWMCQPAYELSQERAEERRHR